MFFGKRKRCSKTFFHRTCLVDFHLTNFHFVLTLRPNLDFVMNVAAFFRENTVLFMLFLYTVTFWPGNGSHCTGIGEG